MLQITLASPEATLTLAEQIAPNLVPGDVLLLEGSVGAGKTAFARALIQHLQDPPEDVPSPTFTLVQTYDTTIGEIWHCDLYRLSNPDEVLELGLEEAFTNGICLIEWPDRLGDLTPASALTFRFAQGENADMRVLTVAGHRSWLEDLK